MKFDYGYEMQRIFTFIFDFDEIKVCVRYGYFSGFSCRENIRDVNIYRTFVEYKLAHTALLLQLPNLIDPQSNKAHILITGIDWAIELCSLMLAPVPIPCTQAKISL